MEDGSLTFDLFTETPVWKYLGGQCVLSKEIRHSFQSCAMFCNSLKTHELSWFIFIFIFNIRRYFLSLSPAWLNRLVSEGPHTAVPFSERAKLGHHWRLWKEVVMYLGQPLLSLWLSWVSFLLPLSPYLFFRWCHSLPQFPHWDFESFGLQHWELAESLGGLKTLVKETSSSRSFVSPFANEELILEDQESLLRPEGPSMPHRQLLDNLTQKNIEEELHGMFQVEGSTFYGPKEQRKQTDRQWPSSTTC